VGATVIDGAGATLMPGLVEAYSHVCYNNCATLADIGRLPPEEHMLLALDNAKLMLDQGFN
jgi:imidazolonepropionase-like amidohydrolase